eukprot:81597_1
MKNVKVLQNIYLNIQTNNNHISKMHAKHQLRDVVVSNSYQNHQFGSFLINDSIVEIASYFIECYNLIHKFTSQNDSPLPVQIDVVFIVKNYIPSSPVEEVYYELCEEVIIGNIEERLKTQMKKIGPKNIDTVTANHVMFELANELIANKNNQRIVFVIDRRKDSNSDESMMDKIYVYKPNNGHCFETNKSKFLFESLINNSRMCILPKLNGEYHDIGINNNSNPLCLTLSFHCFSTNQIQTYLFYNGWGYRFNIQDIKYYMPTFFVKEQKKLLRDVFEQNLNNDFINKYGICKGLCIDSQFENFYHELADSYIFGRSPEGK